MHCLGERSLFSFSFVAVFSPSNALIMLYNIRYWWFFLSQVIDEQNTLYIRKYGGRNLAWWCLHLWSLWTAFTCCCPLSWLLIWLQSEMMDLYFNHCHIFTQKTPFCCAETIANNTLNRLRVVVFDRLWTNAAPTLNIAFSLTNIHAKWWILCLLISSASLLSHTTSIYDWSKRVSGDFLVFSKTTAEFRWPERSVSFLSVQPRLIYIEKMDL